MRPGLIDPEELARTLDHPNLVLLDASLPFPGEIHDADAAFLSAHLPRSRRFDLEIFSDPEPGLPHMVPSQARFARLAGDLGIDPESDVVVYDQRSPFAAPRAWWLFRLFGHDRVRMLDGGLSAWRRFGGAIEAGPPAPCPTARFVPRLRTPMLAGLGDIAGSSTKTIVLDARSAGRFTGAAPEPRPGVPSGHIPASRNLPFGYLFDDSGSLQPDATLRALFGERGVDASARIVASCGTGITAAGLVLGLFVIGTTDVALYDGSWFEYATSGAPIETGDRR